MNLAIYQRVVLTCTPSPEIIHNKKRCNFILSHDDLFPNSVSIVHYKPAVDRLQQMHEHEAVQQNNDGHLNKNWREDLKIADRYEEHRSDFLKMLE